MTKHFLTFSAILFAISLAHIARAQTFLRDVYLCGWAGMDTAEKARAVLQILVEAGWVRRIPVQERHVGRPSEEYIVNPRIPRK